MPRHARGRAPCGRGDCSRRRAPPAGAAARHPPPGPRAARPAAPPAPRPDRAPRAHRAPRAQYYAAFPDFKRRRAALAAAALHLLGVAAPLARHTAPAAGGGGGEDEDDADEAALALAVAVADDALEGADRALDAAAAAAAAAAPLARAPPRGAAAAAGAGAAAGGVDGAGRRAGPLRYDAALPRPQDAFDPPVDNSSVPFVPHAPGRAPAPLPEGGYAHPFQAELDALAYAPWQLGAPEVLPQRDLAAAPATWVDTPAALAAMAAALTGERHVALDLEHHSFRRGAGGRGGGGWGGRGRPAGRGAARAAVHKRRAAGRAPRPPAPLPSGAVYGARPLPPPQVLPGLHLPAAGVQPRRRLARRRARAAQRHRPRARAAAGGRGRRQGAARRGPRRAVAAGARAGAPGGGGRGRRAAARRGVAYAGCWHWAVPGAPAPVPQPPAPAPAPRPRPSATLGCTS